MGPSDVSDDNFSLFGSKCEGLLELHMFRCSQLSSLSAASIANNLQLLQTISMGFGVGTDDGIIEISKGCKELLKLNLIGCDITDEALLSIPENCKSLSMFTIFGNNSITDWESVPLLSNMFILLQLM